MNERPNDDWEKLFEHMPADVTAREQHRDQLRERVLDAFDDAQKPGRQRLGLRQIGRFVMRHKILHWTAASIVIAFAILVYTEQRTPGIRAGRNGGKPRQGANGAL